MVFACLGLSSASAGCLLPSARVSADCGLWEAFCSTPVGAGESEIKQQPFSLALLRLHAKLAGEHGTGLPGHLHSIFCSVFCLCLIFYHSRVSFFKAKTVCSNAVLFLWAPFPDRCGFITPFPYSTPVPLQHAM